MLVLGQNMSCNVIQIFMSLFGMNTREMSIDKCFFCVCLCDLALRT